MLHLFTDRSEMRKCLGMSFLMFYTILGYNIMRGMKEAVLINLPGSGAAYIPLVKLFVVLPLSFALGIFYLSIRQRYGTFRSYYLLASLFLTYFIVYTYLIVPQHNYFHPSADWVHVMQQAYPSFRFLFVILGNWSGALYYACGELWGTFTLLILYWQIANEMFSPERASRIYPILSFISSIALLSASFALKYLVNVTNALETSTMILSCLGVLMLGTVCHIQQLVSNDTSPPVHQVKTKVKPPLRDCIRTVSTQPHILYLTLCIVLFSVLTNMFEVSVKEKMASIYKNQNAYLDFMSTFTQYKGLLCMIINLFNFHFLRRLGWFNIAMITPIVCIVSVNSFLLYNNNAALVAELFGHIDVGFYAAWAGAVGMVAIYASKYTFFDITKEMALIPLADNDRANGKAAVDGVGGRLGKSGYGAIHFVLCGITGFDRMEDLSMYLVPTTIVLSLVWVWVMIQLSKSYNHAVSSGKLPSSTPAYEGVESPADGTPVTATT